MENVFYPYEISGFTPEDVADQATAFSMTVSKAFDHPDGQAISALIDYSVERKKWGGVELNALLMGEETWNPEWAGKKPTEASILLAHKTISAGLFSLQKGDYVTLDQIEGKLVVFPTEQLIDKLSKMEDPIEAEMLLE